MCEIYIGKVQPHEMAATHRHCQTGPGPAWQRGADMGCCVLEECWGVCAQQPGNAMPGLANDADKRCCPWRGCALNEQGEGGWVSSRLKVIALGSHAVTSPYVWNLGG